MLSTLLPKQTLTTTVIAWVTKAGIAFLMINKSLVIHVYDSSLERLFTGTQTKMSSFVLSTSTMLADMKFDKFMMLIMASRYA